jgi:hypothetical protein
MRAGVTGRAGLVDAQQDGIAVAVDPHLANVLHVPGGVPLGPQFLAAA